MGIFLILLDHYQEEILKNMIAPYQYVLNVPEEPDEDEKYTVMGMLQKFLTPSLKTNEKSAVHLQKRFQ